MSAGCSAKPPQSCSEYSSELNKKTYIQKSKNISLQTKKIWRERGGWGGIVADNKGNLIISRSPNGSSIATSSDGGETWVKNLRIDKLSRQASTSGGNLINGGCGIIYYLSPKNKAIYTTTNGGINWSKRRANILLPNGYQENEELIAAMQPGIRLHQGKMKGRLITPARLWGLENNNLPENRKEHTGLALYSDNQGETWTSSAMLDQKGIGESGIAELGDGVLLYNTREHMTAGGRFSAASIDQGITWEAMKRVEIPDGPIGSKYGLMGGLIRLPIKGEDYLIFSNVDSKVISTGTVNSGQSDVRGRENLTLWLSKDGGKSWTCKYSIHKGGSGYSSLASGLYKDQAYIYVLYEGRESNSSNWGVYFSRTSLSAILESKECSDK
ncbi:sialidase family protein [Synechococcus sp. PROS-7-1]|uniref:exo-alpha-sialidase n=1 Tax=Synechococcus sp. PROS-7-1 TaxID=1442556 RepID=UPI0021067C76|nr:sialidase family protein [Synechococcus sp. PROS-7-1]